MIGPRNGVSGYLPVQASGMRVASPSGSRLCHRLQRIPLGTLDAQVAARELPRGQPERDRGAERGRMPKVPKKVYRTILTQGGKELPEIPRRRKGKRGRVAKSFGHNLHDRLLKNEDSVLRFMSDPDVSFTNNTGEQKNQDGKGQNQSLGVLPDRTPCPRLVPDIELSRFNSRTRIQSNRSHSDRA